MEKESRTSPAIKVYTALILLLLYVAIISFPLAPFINGMAATIIGISLKIAYIVFAFFSIYRYDLCKFSLFPNKNWKLLLLIPLVILTFSNWIYVWIFHAPLNSSVDGASLSVNIFIITLVTVFCEELLFREIIHECLRDYIKKDYLLILTSAGIFSIMHFINLFNGMDILSVLAQVGYTFILGLVLGLIKEKKAGFLALMSFHFLFNALNNDLFSALYKGEWNTQFVLTNVIVGTIVVLYGVGMYFLLKNNSSPLLLQDNQNDEVSNASEE